MRLPHRFTVCTTVCVVPLVLLTSALLWTDPFILKKSAPLSSTYSLPVLSDPCPQSVTIMPTEKVFRLRGIDPAYIELLEKAAEPDDEGFPPKHGDCGVAFVLGGQFKYLYQGLLNAERIRKSLRSNDPEIRVAVFTNRNFISLLNTCISNETAIQNAADLAGVASTKAKEGCKLWTFVDDWFAIEDLKVPYTKPDMGHQATTEFWMSTLVANTRAPYTRTLFLDSDAYVCPGFADLFLMADPMDSNNLWTFPSTHVADLVIGVDQYPYNRMHRHHPSPGNLSILTDFEFFSDRNTGTYVLNFHRQEVHTFVRFIQLVAEHLYNNVATKGKEITNDQVPFKLALYLFHKAYDFHENTIPLHSSCRTYINTDHAGTRGEFNGMYPIQNDTGRPCDKCGCTPCLINHLAGTHHVNLN